MSHRRHHSRKKRRDEPGLLELLWSAFWEPPVASCPKCGGTFIAYYDPLLFAPIRSIKGKRRLRCRVCKFIWRPSRNRSSMWDYLGVHF